MVAAELFSNFIIVRPTLTLLLTPQLPFSKQITITMAFLAGVEVSPEEADNAVVTASATGNPGGDLAPLEPLNSIWDCPKAIKGPSVPKRGKTEGWRCGHCGQTFYPVSAPCAKAHLAQMDSGFSIVPCPANIPPREKQRCVCFVLLPFSCTSLTSIDLRVRQQV